MSRCQATCGKERSSNETTGADIASIDQWVGVVKGLIRKIYGKFMTKKYGKIVMKKYGGKLWKNYDEKVSAEYS